MVCSWSKHPTSRWPCTLATSICHTTESKANHTSRWLFSDFKDPCGPDYTGGDQISWKAFRKYALCSSWSPWSVLHILIIIALSFVLCLGQLLKHQNLDSYFEAKVPSLKEFTRTKAIANTNVPTSRLLANVMQLLQRCACCLFTIRGWQNLDFEL